MTEWLRGRHDAFPPSSGANRLSTPKTSAEARAGDRLGRMSTPIDARFSGVHHVSLTVTDLEASLVQQAALEHGRAVPTTKTLSADRAMAAIARVMRPA